MTVSGPFQAVSRSFPAILLTIQDRFLPISDPFPTISDRFVNRPTNSDSFPASSRPILGRPTHRGGTTGDRPATETGASSEPSQTTHGRYNTGPQGQNTGRSHRQQQHTHKADVSRTTSQRSPFLNFPTISSSFPTISFKFQTNSHPTTDHFRPLPRRASTTHGPLTGGTTWDHRVKSHRQHQHTCQHIVGLMSFRRRSKVRGRGGGGGGGKVEPY